MKGIEVSITRFIDNHCPGFVECKFYDVFNKEHIVHEKVPILTDKYLDADSEYPQDGIIACEIIGEYKDVNGKTILRVSTVNPWSVDTWRN